MKHMLTILISAMTFFAFMSNVSVEAEEVEKPTIAVFDFGIANTVTKRVTDMSGERGRRTRRVEFETSLLSDRFITALTRTGNITVVERSKISQIMEESELSQSDLTDPAHSMELGKLLGADYFLFGTISMLDGSIETRQLPYGAGTHTSVKFTAGANIRIVETETGKIIAAESTRVENEDSLMRQTIRNIPEEFRQETYDMLVDKMVNAVTKELFPTLVALYSDDVVYINTGRIEKGVLKRVIQPEGIPDSTVFSHL